MSEIRTLSIKEAADYYDSFGSKQDSQEFYEGPPLEDLLAHLDLARISSIFEFGCGTGKFAEKMLRSGTPPDCIYTGMDVSQKMVDLATHRLSTFGQRATVTRSEGSCRLDLRAQSYDLIVANYVLDLLSFDNIEVLLRSFFDALKPEGRLGLVSLTHGNGGFSNLAASLWKGVHKLSPKLVGGCRPVELIDFLPKDQWTVTYRQVLTPFSIPSEIVITKKRLPNSRAH